MGGCKVRKPGTCENCPYLIVRYGYCQVAEDYVVKPTGELSCDFSREDSVQDDIDRLSLENRDLDIRLTKLEEREE